ncbi:hypothetical protein, partial [Deinococcus sp. RIT780]|uniref:hypothetical protein n=1 Tax=Deinococcus sp. RIT780 TaxID=2870472 RepID=UPI001C8ABF0C
GTPYGITTSNHPFTGNAWKLSSTARKPGTSTPDPSTNKPHGVAVSRRYGPADANGHRKSANTSIGGAWSFKDGKAGMKEAR